MKEIVEAKKADTALNHFFNSNAVPDKGLELQLVENKSCICNKGGLVIPKPLSRRAILWYHNYLQQPGHTRLEETVKALIGAALENFLSKKCFQMVFLSAIL